VSKERSHPEGEQKGVSSKKSAGFLRDVEHKGSHPLVSMPCRNLFFSAGGGSLPAKDWQAGAYGGSNSFGEEPLF